MWPFKRRGDNSDPALPPALERITADTPRRLSITLADPAAADRAIEVLNVRLGKELTVTTRRDASGRPVLDLVSTFAGGNAVRAVSPDAEARLQVLWDQASRES